MSKAIRILIADDHPVVRRGLVMVISNEIDMEVIAEAINGEEAVEKALALKPDIVLMDLQMPRKNGIEAMLEIKQAEPAIRILVLSSFTDDERVFPAIKGGASGYLLKDSLPDVLLNAIREIAQGRPSLDPIIAEKLMHEVAHPETTPNVGDKLTKRELEVLKQISQGKNNHEIAEMLVVSERTVSTHISNILNKLHLENRTQAALYAFRQGLVDRPPKE
ncbi:MAG: response regulator transcription factor [Anaerolineaceae bacterium]|nr:response regulator transcription factor [Anaerolineaceae bacterium]